MKSPRRYRALPAYPTFGEAQAAREPCCVRTPVDPETIRMAPRNQKPPKFYETPVTRAGKVLWTCHPPPEGVHLIEAWAISVALELPGTTRALAEEPDRCYSMSPGVYVWGADRNEAAHNLVARLAAEALDER